jgi:hypothetical protein
MKRVNLPIYLIDILSELDVRTRAGEPVTRAERKWIAAELAGCDGYLEWHAMELLDRALTKKALA